MTGRRSRAALFQWFAGLALAGLAWFGCGASGADSGESNDIGGAPSLGAAGVGGQLGGGGSATVLPALPAEPGAAPPLAGMSAVPPPNPSAQPPAAPSDDATLPPLGGAPGSSMETSGTAPDGEETAAGGAGGAPGEPDATSNGESTGTTSAGAGGNTGADEPGGAGCDAAGVAFCSDFEADSLPAEFQFFPEYQRDNIANFVTIDSTHAVSGSRSVKVVGSEFSQMLGVETPGSTFWGRVYLRSDTDIQSGHNTYVAATDGDGDPNNGEHIRIGEHQCQLEVNRRTDDAEKLSNGGTYECSGGVKLSANTWYCLEFFYDGPGSTVQVFVDGTEVPELHVTDWGPYDYKLFKFGFEKYHGGAKTLWYDDLALGSQRVGCSE